MKHGRCGAAVTRSGWRNSPWRSKPRCFTTEMVVLTVFCCTLFLAPTVDAQGTQYPPVAMAALTLNSGGTYTASVSQASGTTSVWGAFDRVSASTATAAQEWYTSDNYYTATGTYPGMAGTVATTVSSGTSYSGTWAQLQVPTAIWLCSYALFSTVTVARGPKNFIIAGSTDGATWTTVDAQRFVCICVCTTLHMMKARCFCVES
jgi:hypothetical protein